MSDHDDGEATPRLSQSFRVFEEAARELARRLDDCAVLKSTAARPDAYDRAGATEARRLAHALRLLADRFASWPTANAETVCLERPALTGDLLRLQREAETLMSTTPKTLPPRS